LEDEVGRMLGRLAGSEDLAPFRALILPLEAYDRKRRGDLVRTLTAYLECGGNVTEAADRLFLHRNSVPYRLERISSLTRLDLKDHRARLALQLGLLAAKRERSVDE